MNAERAHPDVYKPVLKTCFWDTVTYVTFPTNLRLPTTHIFRIVMPAVRLTDSENFSSGPNDLRPRFIQSRLKSSSDVSSKVRRNNDNTKMPGIFRRNVKTLVDLSNDVIPNQLSSEVIRPKRKPATKTSKDVPPSTKSQTDVISHVIRSTTRTSPEVIPTPTMKSQTDVICPIILPTMKTPPSDLTPVKSSTGVVRDTSTKKRHATDSSHLPIAGEKPHDLLQRLYELWPVQMSASYRPHAVLRPEATADFNFRFLRQLHPPAASKSEPLQTLQKVKAAGVVVETVFHLGKKVHYNLNWKRTQHSSGLQK